jgi:hypothetical protein
VRSLAATPAHAPTCQHLRPRSGVCMKRPGDQFPFVRERPRRITPRRCHATTDCHLLTPRNLFLRTDTVAIMPDVDDYLPQCEW